MKILYEDETAVVFRAETRNEARAISQLSRLAHFEDSRYVFFRKNSILYDYILVLGLKVENKIAGYLVFSKEPFIKQIYVLPEFRNRGFEGLLTELAEKKPETILFSRGLRSLRVKP